MFGIG